MTELNDYRTCSLCGHDEFYYSLTSAKWRCERCNSTLDTEPTDTVEAEIRKFDTGASRDIADHKHDYEGFLSIHALRAYGEYMHSHRKMRDGSLRDSDNWQKGIPKNEYMKSLMRHFFDAWEIHRTGAPVKDFDGNEVKMKDALCGILFNTFGYLHTILTEKDDAATR